MRSPNDAETRNVAEGTPLFWRLYRLLWGLGRPFIPLVFRSRLRRGKEHRDRLEERRGHASRERPHGPLVWIHCASVGELISVIPLMERIRSREIDVLATSGTVTAAALAAQRMPAGVIHQFAPVDSPHYVRRFLGHWKPDLALLVESDLWPNYILETSKRSVPLILVNGRMSEHSYRRWRRLPHMIGPLLQRFDLCLARAEGDAQRFTELGAPRVITTGNLKFDVPAPPANAEKLRALENALGDRPLFGAASTHAGEDAIVIAAHRMLRGRVPGLITAIAPRHPERGPGIAEIAASDGLKSVLRSRGHLPDATTDIYICDTIGELGLFYRLAPIVFIGGSLVRHGGQNPIEAAKLGAAILHGAHVGNFAEVYAALDDAHGALEVSDSQTLAQHVYAWLREDDARVAAADQALNTVENLGGALERTLQSLEPYLMQLRLGNRGRHA
jgi:3-deoxy-D-manno-octulosonic-acid transferase